MSFQSTENHPQFFKTLFVFVTLSITKIFAKIFYRIQEIWTTPYPPDWDQIKCIGVLNHTSLFEPLLVGIYPFRQLWRAAKHMVAPAADITMNRKFVGLFFSLLGQHVIPISRKRDHSWNKFLDKISPESLVVILPEGRMMRNDGRDKNGKMMDIRPGIADILIKMTSGHFMIMTSGGLHHVQRPGQLVPRIFKTIQIVAEIHNISELTDQISLRMTTETKAGEMNFKKTLLEFLESRKKYHLELMKKAKTNN